MFPYLDLTGFTARTVMSPIEVAEVEQTTPGYLGRRIAVASSYINGRLRKRYGNNGAQNSLPLGQSPPMFVSDVKPLPTLQGRPMLGSLELYIEIDGVNTFRWSTDGGVTFRATGIAIVASVALVGTGLTIIFGSDPYTTGAIYVAAPPVPEIVLGWITTLVTDDAYRKRGRNPQDPAMQDSKDDVVRVLAEIKEAADSKDGLFDLPVSEDLDSAVTTGFVLGYSETSPYVWTEQEAREGRQEDALFSNLTATNGARIV